MLTCVRGERNGLVAGGLVQQQQADVICVHAVVEVAVHDRGHHTADLKASGAVAAISGKGSNDDLHGGLAGVAMQAVALKKKQHQQSFALGGYMTWLKCNAFSKGSGLVLAAIRRGFQRSKAEGFCGMGSSAALAGCCLATYLRAEPLAQAPGWEALQAGIQDRFFLRVRLSTKERHLFAL